MNFTVRVRDEDRRGFEREYWLNVDAACDYGCVELKSATFVSGTCWFQGEPLELSIAVDDTKSLNRIGNSLMTLFNDDITRDVRDQAIARRVNATIRRQAGQDE